jgi:hypothetical protein
MIGLFARSRVLCSLCVSVLRPKKKARPAHSINLLGGVTDFSLS